MPSMNENDAMYEITKRYRKQIKWVMAHFPSLFCTCLKCGGLSYLNVAPDGFGTCDVCWGFGKVLKVLKYRQGFYGPWKPLTEKEEKVILVWRLGDKKRHLIPSSRAMAEFKAEVESVIKQADEEGLANLVTHPYVTVQAIVKTKNTGWRVTKVTKTDVRALAKEILKK